jgi:carbon-monoxide dehydrogenase large subunit
MIANAIDNALGIRIKSMPITAEKICMTLLEHQKKKNK